MKTFTSPQKALRLARVMLDGVYSSTALQSRRAGWAASTSSHVACVQLQHRAPVGLYNGAVEDEDFHQPPEGATIGESYVGRCLQLYSSTVLPGWLGGEQQSSRAAEQAAHQAPSSHVACVQLQHRAPAGLYNAAVEDGDPHQPPEGATMGENYVGRCLQLYSSTVLPAWLGGEQASSSRVTKHRAFTLHVSSYRTVVQLASTMVL